MLYSFCAYSVAEATMTSVVPRKEELQYEEGAENIKFYCRHAYDLRLEVNIVVAW